MVKHSIALVRFALILAMPLFSEEVADAAGDESEGLACPISPEWVSSDPERLTSDRESIDQLMKAWSKAVETADLETLVSLVTEDCEFWTNGAPPLIGREALASAFGPFLKRYEMRQELACQELVISGNLAFLRGTEINHLTPTGGGEPIVRRQRAFSVLRRSPDGEWLFARGMTNLPPE